MLQILCVCVWGGEVDSREGGEGALRDEEMKAGDPYTSSLWFLATKNHTSIFPLTLQLKVQKSFSYNVEECRGC